MNNSQLESSIKANQIALESLTKERTIIFDTIETNRKAIESKFHDFCVANIASIPTRMKESIKFHIASEIIRPIWKEYSREDYTSSIDIYYRPKNSYDTKEGEYRWEFSHSSGRYHVCSNPETQKQMDNEYKDYMQLSLNMHDVVNNNKEFIANIHEEYRLNERSHYDLTSAIDKLERDIKTYEAEILRNNIIANFKPAGETAKWLMNKEITMPTPTTWYYTNRYSCYFDTIVLIKETKKGIRAEFRSKHTDKDGTVTSYVKETKVVDLEILINIWKMSLSSLRDTEERARKVAEREAREKLTNAA